MPRRRPARVRARDQRERHSIPIHGVPLPTSRALDRLDRPQLSSRSVRVDLRTWHDVAHLPRSALQREHNDWVRFVGPSARDALEEAMCAVPRRPRALLRGQIAQLDALFLDKTSNDPLVDPSLPWWFRRT